ncbi:MAG: GTP-binding protein, partial [Acidimicrobiales bacterium]
MPVKSFPPAKIRNVALVGHGGAGKTSVAEALLFCAKAISRQGRVEDGTTTSDFDPEEVRRGISLSATLLPFEYDGHKINLLDCPGYADFITEVDAALRVADLAVFVVSAVEGVEVQTEAAWRIAAERGLPRLIFVNKLDRDRASFGRTLDQLRSAFGAGVAPLELPIGEEAGFRGVADLLTDTAITYEGGQPTRGEIPAEMEALEHQVHDNLVEGIVVADDDLMERYLEGDTPSPKELEDTLAKGVAAGTVFPVVCGSATRNVAIDRLAAFVCEIGPAPLDRP